MWYTLLPKVLNMSLTASMVILFVLLARLVLKQAPKVFSYLLWIVVIFRLLCPVTLTSNVSFLSIIDVPVTQTSTIEYIPTNIVHTEYPTVDIPIPGVSEAIHETLHQGEEQLAADPLEALMSIATYIWFFGFVALLVYSAVSLLKLRQKLIGAVPLRDNIYLADYITSPFVIGLFRPKIYLPSSLTGNEQEYLLLHEQYHIRRFDHVIKLLSFAALCVHWFNPLVWLAFVLSGKDMEMSCDEAVLAKIGEGIRGNYSASLLSLATGRRMIAGALLAFGEGDTKGRIKNVLNWKKPSVWITTLAAAICIIIITACTFNPKDDTLYASEPFDHTYRVTNVVFDAPQYSFTYTPETAPQYCLTSDYQLMVKEDMQQENEADGWKSLGGMSEVALTEDNFDRYFIMIDDISGWRGEESMEKVRRDNQKAWRLILENDPNHVFYYVLQQKNDDVYLAYGYHDPESETEYYYGASSSIRWLFQLALDPVSNNDRTDEPSDTFADNFTEPDPLDTAITNAILEFNKSRTSGGDLACENHIILATEEGGSVDGGETDTVTVYAMVLYETYAYSGATFQSVGGSHIPTALTFDVGTGGEYTLTEYWQPRDGSYYAQDIREKFSKAIRKDALDTQKFILPQIQACYTQAVEYGNVNTDEVIDHLFEVILSSPTASSVPGDYIDAHPIEYRELTYYGDYTLRYIFSAFLKGGQTDLKGYLMRIVMDELIGGEAINQEVSNGQKYFGAWMQSAERMEMEYGLDYMKKNAPKAYLLLQLVAY